MAHLIQESKITLSYPLYAVDFDPQDANRLVAGGGGGAGRSGVGNKISLLDTSSPSTIQPSSEIELSRDEDNVTTLAVGQVRGRSTLVYAGVNSSPADVQKGKNEHFRVFGIDQASKAKAPTSGPKISELARGCLFSTKEADTYQRLLRITAPYPGSAQLGAVATGLAKEAQIALFDVSPTGSAGPKPRGTLDISREAMDLDITQTGDDQYQLAFCSEYELFVVNIAKGGAPSQPVSIYTIDRDELPRPSFRAIRYLTPSFILAVWNVPKQGGVIMHGLRLTPTGKEQARLAVSAKLPRTVQQATGLALRNLSPPASATAKQGDAQFVIAVAGHNSSISLYTLEYQTVGSADAMVNLFPFKTLKDVHALQIIGLAFSHFSAPKTATSRQQLLKLASVSVGSTVAVHAISLRKVLEKPASARRAGPPRQPRYVVGLKPKKPTAWSLLLVMGVGFALLAVALRGALEMTGHLPPRTGLTRALPASWTTPYRPPEPPEPRRGFLVDFLERHRAATAADGGDDSGSGGGTRFLLREDDLTRVEGEEARLQLVVHDERADEGAREWAELPPRQQAAWKRKLKRAGHWTEEAGEGILEDLLFGQLAGAVGAAVAGGG